MEIQDALESGKFTVKALTASINNADVPNTRLAELGWFQERGIRTTHADIEYKDGQIILVPEKERGADGTRTEDRTRNVFTFKAVHLPLEGAIYADDIQNVRAFGSDDELEDLDTLIAEKHEDHRLSLDATVEHLRMGAIVGKVMGASGEVIENLFTKFGITPAYDTVDFAKPDTLRTQLLDIKRKSEKAQKGIKAKRYRALCSAAFFDQLLQNDGFKEAFDRYQNGAALRDDVRAGVSWNNVIWEELDEIFADKKYFGDRDDVEAVLVPEDKPGLFITRFAPANYNETVNTIGLPYYSRSEAKRMGKGVDIESQTNVINVCTSPLAVRRLKMTTAPAQ